METFSALLAICAGNSLVTGEFPAQRPVMQSFELVCFNVLLCCQLNKCSYVTIWYSSMYLIDFQMGKYSLYSSI